jgi:hypothetical protein
MRTSSKGDERRLRRWSSELMPRRAEPGKDVDCVIVERLLGAAQD